MSASMGQIDQRKIMLEAATARTLLNNEVFQGWLNDLVANNREAMVFNTDPEQREAARQQILAISTLRNMISMAASLPEDLKEAEETARSLE